MESDQIRRLMDRHIISIDIKARASVALELIRNSNLSILPVISEGRLVGIAREAALKGADTVSSAMEKPLFIENGKSIDYAIRYITKHGIGRVPIVDSAISMRCIGIISSTALLKAKKSC